MIKYNYNNEALKILVFLIISCFLLIISFIIYSQSKYDPDALYFSSVNNEEEILSFEQNK